MHTHTHTPPHRYISTTTTGLGDFYIPHEDFGAGDMFYVPLIFLTAFVLLANFLVKLSDWVSLRTAPLHWVHGRRRHGSRPHGGGC